MLTEKKGVDGKILYHIFFYTRKKKTEYLLGCRKIKKPFPNGNGIKFKMEAWMGFEPIHRGFANRSLNPLSTTPKELLISSMPFNIPVF